MHQKSVASEQKEILLAKAQQADANAIRSTGQRAKEAWRKIAESYRFLAANS